MSQAHQEDKKYKQNQDDDKMDQQNNGTVKSNGRVITAETSDQLKNNQNTALNKDVSSIFQPLLFGNGTDVTDKTTAVVNNLNEEVSSTKLKNGVIKSGEFIDNERREESAVLTVINEEKVVASMTKNGGIKHEHVDALEPVVLAVIDEENKGNKEEIVVPPRRRQSDEASKIIFPPPRRGSADGATKRRQSDEIPKSPLIASETSRRHSAENADETLRRSGIGCAESGVLRPRTSLTSLASQDGTASPTPAVAASVRPPAPVRGRLYSSSSDRANGKRSLPPMSSMEEENLRERIHASLIKQCAEYVHKEQRYTKDTFKRLFQSKVNILFRLRIYLFFQQFVFQLEA